MSLREFIEAHALERVAVLGADLHGYARGKQFAAARWAGGAPELRLTNIMAALDGGNLPLPPPGDPRGWPAWGAGFGDLSLEPDEASARLVPWQPRTGLVLCEFGALDGSDALDYLPRPLLRRLEARAAATGLETRAAHELEFVLFDEAAARRAGTEGPLLRPLWSTPQAFILTTLGKHAHVLGPMLDGLEAFGLAVEAWNAEAAPGQVEINLAPAGALAAADHAFLFKHAVKELAAAHGCLASFMAMPVQPGFGSGDHLNLSLWRNGQNVFADPATLRHAVGGILASLRELTVLYAPTPNAYRRFASHLATGMVVAWGEDNRSVAVRTVTDTRSGARIELRTAGADANPYLVTAAALVGALHGIEQAIEPPPPCCGDAYADPALARVPDSLPEAVQLFEASSLARTWLGEDFVRFFAHTRRGEAAAFAAAVGDEVADDAVSAWELERYLELV
ncbi:MAG: glutamine synthetase family protein [Gammaproteobacteria bacterium]